MKKILFIISGSISAYKLLDLLKDLVKENFDIEVILTKAGKEFITPLSITSLLKKEIHTDIFSKKKYSSYMKHINYFYTSVLNLEHCNQVYIHDNGTNISLLKDE